MRGAASIVLMVAGVIAIAIAISCGPAAIAPRRPPPPPDPSRSVAVGSAFYLTEPVGGEKPPSDQHGRPVAPKVTADFEGPPQTNDWWSSLIWQHQADDPHSQPMYPHPLAVEAESGGLALSYPDVAEVSDRAYVHRHAKDLVVGVVGLAAPDTRVGAYSDWTVTASWRDGQGGMKATFGHGLPFVYVEVDGARDALVGVAAGKTARTFAQDGEAIGISIGTHHYGLFAPPGASWARGGGSFTSDLDGAGYYAVAILPDDSPKTLALYHRHAYAFVKETRVSWSVDAPAGEVVTTYDVAIERKAAGREWADTPILALYRHQWLRTRDRLLPFEYASPRGRMKTIAARRFETRLPTTGVLPILPVVDGEDRDELRGRVRDELADGALFPPGLEGKKDSYWSGKSLGKAAILAQLADQVGDAWTRDQLLTGLKNELEDWFDGQAPLALWYEPVWRTMIALPTAYFSGTQLNDHHFHYGYFIFAAATVAQLDPAWAARDRYGGIVELLIRDAASWDRSDARFPFLRGFDVYAGHSWANGPALFADGNNEESSSEDMLFAVALILWGTATKDDTVRDLGLFLQANLTAAIEQYWFDVDGEVFPPDFPRGALGIVWGSGGRYDTWWDPSPIYVHGINYLPFTGGSLYLARRPAYAAANVAELVKANRGEALQWRDIVWMYLALTDPERAAALYEENRWFEPEFGSSHAWLSHWIQALRLAGSIDPSVRSDWPASLVLKRGETRTHCAWNPGDAAREVRFSDGATLDAPPRSLRCGGRHDRR